MMPDLVRADGLGWAFGRAAGAYGQMHCVSLILQGLRDGWIPDDQRREYFDILRRLFLFFYQTYLDQEQGFLDLRDDERTAYEQHTTRMANFDAARYLCQWSRLVKTVQMPAGAPWSEPPAHIGPVCHLRQGQPQGAGPLPLPRRGVGPAPDAPAHQLRGASLERRAALPPLPRRLRLAEQRLPAGHAARAHLRRPRHPARVLRQELRHGPRDAQQLLLPLRAARPDHDQGGDGPQPGQRRRSSGTSRARRSACEFAYTVKQQVTLDKFRYVLVVAAPHSKYRVPGSPVLGPLGHRCSVIKDDFQATWQDTEVVSADPTYRTNFGKIHYLQYLIRDHPLIMRPGHVYRLAVNFEPDVVREEG